MHFRFLAMSLCLMGSLCMLSGCSSGNLMNSEDMVGLVEKVIPNSSFVELTSKKGIDYSKKGRNLYEFTNGDFSYMVENYITEGAILDSNVIRDNYLYSLVSFYYNDIVSLAENYNIDIICDSVEKVETSTAAIYCKMIENPEKAYIRIIVNNMGESNMKFEVYLNNEGQIESVYDCIYGIYDILKGSFPSIKNNSLYFVLSLNFHTKETMLRTATYQPKPIMKDKTILLSRGLTLGMDVKCLQDCYKNNVRVNNTELVYDGEFIGCPEYIDRLFINGKEYKLEDYSFLYNAEDGRYYAKVYCGVEPTNGGNLVGEKVQKAILEMLYPDCNYVIESGKSSSYVLNGELYKISRGDGGFVFSKNDKDLKIENYDKLSFNPFNTENSQFVYINDFAEILGLQVRLIDINQGIIHLENIEE